MNLLVTGGAGFIGSNFIRYILDTYSDYRVINLDKLTYAGNPSNLADLAGDPRYVFVQGDIGDAALGMTTKAPAESRAAARSSKPGGRPVNGGSHPHAAPKGGPASSLLKMNKNVGNGGFALALNARPDKLDEDFEKY